MRSLALCLFMLPTSAWAGVVINEALVDPDGGDTGNEWIELYNSGPSTVDLSAWTIETANSTFSTKVTFESGTSIAPGDYLVVGGESVTFADIHVVKLAMGNASSSGDAVRLVDNTAAVVDTLIYGPNNNDAFQQDDGAVATSLATVAKSGNTMARVPDGLDTDDCGADFKVLTEPTPGASNGEGPPECKTGNDIVINEFLPDPEGSDDGLEWVELYNASDEQVQLAGWVLDASTSVFGGGLQLPEQTMDAGQYIVIGEVEGPNVDIVLNLNLGNATSSADGVQLRDCDGTVLDTVIYGVDNSDEFHDDLGLATSLAPKPSSGMSLARSPASTDTDLSADDFSLQTELTQGTTNPEPPPCDISDKIVINEFIADPDGPDAGQEWIELYNAGDQDITVSDWVLIWATSSFGTGQTLPDLILPAGGYLVIGEEGVPEADLIVEMSLGNASSSADGLQLRDCQGDVVDTVIYGPNNDDGFIDDTGEIAVDLASKPSSGASHARVEDGYDSNNSFQDFALDPKPTPGAANPVREPVICEPNPSTDLVINEILANPDGDDEGFEWIELYNPGGSAVSVAGWGFASAGKPDQQLDVDFTLPGGAQVEAGGYYVVGGTFVDEADDRLRFTIGNGTAGDALSLFDCESNRIDTVVYGDNNDDLMTDDTDQVVDPYVATGNGATMARLVDGVDTDSSSDWFSDRSPTPGANNFQEKSDVDPGGKGCGSGSLDDTEPGTGCGSSAPPPTMAMFGLLFLGGLSRRRKSA